MNSLRPCSGSPNVTRVLLSIRPEFVIGILRGNKRYEFRRIMFARNVDTVLIYATVPIRRVVAEFDIHSIITESVPLLWSKTHQFAGINRGLFLRYFEGRELGHAIEIGEVRPYRTPYCPIKELGLKPPQSFVYVGNYPNGRCRSGTGNGANADCR